MKLITIVFLIINNDKVSINKVLDDLHLFDSQAKGK